MTICKGCGVKLQFNNPDKPGFSPKKEVTYCQRCFRIRHYDDLIYSMKKGIDPNEVLRKAAGYDALVVWICDLFDFEGSMIGGLNRHLLNKDIMMVVSKRDLFSKDIPDRKFINFIKKRLDDFKINVKGILLTCKNNKKDINEIILLLKKYAGKKAIIVIGKANVGKSSFLNMLKNDDTLTKSLYPGTTLDFIEFEIDGQKFIDTPGIEINNSMLMAVKEEDLNLIVPKNEIKPIIFQIHEPQSFAIGGLARIDFNQVSKGSVIFYVSNRLKLHRGKIDKADNFWKIHKGKLLIPFVEEDYVKTKFTGSNEKMEIVIDGLGFIKYSGDVKEIIVHHPKNVNVIVRKAML